MKNPIIKTIAIIVVLSTAACTTQLDLRRTDTFTNTLPTGITYSLPAVSYQTDTVWELAKCKNQGEEAPFYQIGVRSTVNELFVPDDHHSYVLNYEALDSGAKITTLDLAFHPGTPFLKSLNSQVEDRSGEIIGNVVTGVLAVATATSGFPGLPGGADIAAAKEDKADAERGVQLFRCRQTVVDALDEIERSKIKITVLEDEIDGLNALDWLVGKPESEFPEKCRNLGEDYVERKQCLQDAVDAKSQRVAKHQDYIAGIKKKNHLVYAQSKVVVPEFCKPSTGSNETCKRESLYKTQISDLSNMFDIWFDRFDPVLDRSSINEHINLQVQLISTKHSKTVNEVQIGDESIAGLVYRNPRDAVLSLSRQVGMKKVELTRQQVVIPQAGQAALLPFKNEVFDNNSLSVDFSLNGSLVNAKYTTQAEAERASAAFAENASTFLDYRQARNDQELTELKREIEIIRAQEEKIKAQQSLDALRNR